jgi:DNA-binding transcriptional LysR family regulator
MAPDKSRIVADLEEGRYDLCIGALEDGSSDLIQRALFEEEFVTAQRIGHPRGTKALTLGEFCAYDHLLISTDGGGFSGKVDTVLAGMGLERRVSLSIQSYALTPVFLGGSDCLCTLPRRFLSRFGDRLDLFETPLPLDKFGLYAFWHQRVRNDPAHIWLRDRLFQAAEEASAAR